MTWLQRHLERRLQRDEKNEGWRRRTEPSKASDSWSAHRIDSSGACPNPALVASPHYGDRGGSSSRHHQRHQPSVADVPRMCVVLKTLAFDSSKAWTLRDPSAKNMMIDMACRKRQLQKRDRDDNEEDGRRACFTTRLHACRVRETWRVC